MLLQWVEAEDDDNDASSPSSSTSDTASTSSSSRKRLKRVDTFHSYVRPTWRPELGEFCTSLTGITQVSRGSLEVTRPAARVSSSCNSQLTSVGHGRSRTDFSGDAAPAGKVVGRTWAEGR